MKKKNRINILVYILFFYIIYTPSFSSSIFFDKNITIPIITIMVLFYGLLFKKNNLFKIFQNKKILLFGGLILLSNVYYLIVNMNFNMQFSLFDSRILQNSLPIFYFILIAMLFQILRLKGWDKKDVFNILIRLAMIQGVICILMLFIPSFKEVALDLYYKGAENNIFISNARIFGISSDYTYAMPIYHGFLAAMLFYEYLKKTKTNLISMILVLVPAALNGRTGILVFFVCCCIISFFYCVREKKIMRFIKIITLVGILIFVFLFTIKEIAPATYDFIISFVIDTKNLVLYGDYAGNYGILKNTFYFPEGYQFIFGEGHRVYGEAAIKLGYVSSDIGYVNDSFMGGLVYMIPLYCSYFFLICSSFKGKEMRNKCIQYILVFTLLIANFKGEAFRSSILIFLILFLCLLEIVFPKINSNNPSEVIK